jgi:hypothetical protein
VNDEEEFISKVFITIRDMFTRVKNDEPTISTISSEYAWPTIDPDSKAPRFD